MRRTIPFIAAYVMAMGAWAQSGSLPTDSSSARRTAFRAFAERFLGEWRCEIKEFDGSSAKPVWSDVQRRVFSFTMSRHMLEERAFLKAQAGEWYEGGLHLITFDPKADRITQHGYWLPTQADRLFFIEGQIAGKDFDGQMTIRLEGGGNETRPYRIRWRSNDEWIIEVDGRRADGTTYLREIVVYSRASPPPPAVPGKDETPLP